MGDRHRIYDRDGLNHIESNVPTRPWDSHCESPKSVGVCGDIPSGNLT